MANTFLKAEWRRLAMMNYEIDPKLLTAYVPYKTELDFYEGKCFVSVIGFMFLNTKIKGFKIPFHVNFEEVNLRFYVRYKEGENWKRGAVFIKEMVPKAAITLVANSFYGEHYETLPMRHQWLKDPLTQTIAYRWKKNNKWNHIKVETEYPLLPIPVGSEEEFITEHYWGYARVNDAKTNEYRVSHPRWKMYEIENYELKLDIGILYGEKFAFLQNQKPNSIMLAEGSETTVASKRVIRSSPPTLSNISTSSITEERE